MKYINKLYKKSFDLYSYFYVKEIKNEFKNIAETNYVFFHKENYKGFVPWLSELFDELKLPHWNYENSILVKIEDKIYNIFQNSKNNKLQFYFSDIFKGRKFYSFFKRLKKWFKEKLGNRVLSVFNKIEKLMFDELGNIVENVKTKFKFYKEDNLVHFKIENIMNFIFKLNDKSININIEKNIFRENKEKFLNFINKFINIIEKFLFNDFYTNKIYISIKERPKSLLSF